MRKLRRGEFLGDSACGSPRRSGCGTRDGGGCPRRPRQPTGGSAAGGAQDRCGLPRPRPRPAGGTAAFDGGRGADTARGHGYLEPRTAGRDGTGRGGGLLRAGHRRTGHGWTRRGRRSRHGCARLRRARLRGARLRRAGLRRARLRRAGLRRAGYRCRVSRRHGNPARRLGRPRLCPLHFGLHGPTETRCGDAGGIVVSLQRGEDRIRTRTG
ncbi:pentapeptide repeat-containing protein [Streptomyces sp. NPDC004610]|uniref:pentapeptide repeat-containing protein n=1 Tax=unclassified Streptomyces TaxID=2593676 RepID=UPI00339FD60D